jgi:hypothetical protein
MKKALRAIHPLSINTNHPISEIVRGSFTDFLHAYCLHSQYGRFAVDILVMPTTLPTQIQPNVG